MTNNVDFVQVYLSDMARHEADLSLLVTITIGVVALIFAIGAFLVWRENKASIEAAQLHLGNITNKRQEIDAWYEERKTSLDMYLKCEIDKFSNQIDEMRRYQTLLAALQNDKPDTAAIFQSLCVLAERPCALYSVLFRQIITRAFSPEITDRAEMGLKRWENKLKKANKQQAESEQRICT